MTHARTAYSFLLILSLIWGSSFILITEGLHALSPTHVAGLRIGIAGLVLMPFVRWRTLRLSRKEWATLFISGLLGNLIPAFLFALAQTRIPSSLSGALNALTPIFVLVAGLTVFKVPFNRFKVFGILTGFTGVLLLLLNNGLELRGGGYSGFVLIATLCYGINVNIIKYRLGHLPPLLVAAAPLGMMAIVALVILGMDAGLPAIAVQNWRSYAAVITLAILGTALSLLWFNKLIQQSNAVFASSVTYLIPVVALFWGMAYGEPIDAQQILGMLVVFGGIYLVNKA